MKCFLKTVLVVTMVVGIILGHSLYQRAWAEEITISMSTWLSLQEVSKDMMLEIARRYEEQHPGMKLNLIGVPFEQQLQQTLIAASGANMPDIVHLNPKWEVPLAYMGALEDLHPYFSEEEKQDIPEATFESGVVNGKLVSVPLQIGSIVVLGSKKLLAEAGLPEEIPETWDEFKDAVRKISALGDDIYGFGARTAKTSNSAFWFFPVLRAHGGDLEDVDGNIMFNSAGTIAALEWYKEIGQGKQTPMGMGIPEVRNLFGQGKVGFIFDGPWMKGVMRSITGLGEEVDDDYIVGLFPKGVDGKRYGIGNNHVLAVSSQSKHKKEAIAFIKFFTQNEEITKFHYEKMGAIPGYQSLLNDPLYSEDPYAKAFVDSAAFSDCVPSKDPSFNAALEEMAAGLQEVLLGGDAADVAKKLDDKFQEIYDQ